MTRSFGLTPLARRDLISIGRYTSRRWGKAQRDKYLAALDRRFEWLAEDPRRGMPRPEIGESVHSFPEGSHVIFYVVRQTRIDVVGIPHQAMDFLTHLGKGRW